MVFQSQVNAGSTVLTTPNTDLTIGAWHHLVFVRDRTAGTFQLWQNGQAITNGNTNPTFLTTSWESAYIGYYSGQYIDGLLDQVRFYNYALSATEVSLLYNYGVGN
jgi:hypothetical protein